MGTLHVCFLWHMHQPSYVDPTSGVAIMPWVRLHGVKAYTEMAVALEAVPGARATFNWVPGLCDALEREADPARAPSSEFLSLTLRPAASLGAVEREAVRTRFFSLDHRTMLEPWARYRELHARAEVNALDVDDLRDLQIWFNLAWCSPTVRERPEVAALIERGRGFSEADKAVLIAAQRATAASRPAAPPSCAARPTTTRSCRCSSTATWPAPPTAPRRCPARASAGPTTPASTSSPGSRATARASASRPAACGPPRARWRRGCCPCCARRSWPGSRPTRRS
jgi:hypothetical protein